MQRRCLALSSQAAGHDPAVRAHGAGDDLQREGVAVQRLRVLSSLVPGWRDGCGRRQVPYVPPYLLSTVPRPLRVALVLRRTVEQMKPDVLIEASRAAHRGLRLT